MVADGCLSTLCLMLHVSVCVPVTHNMFIVDIERREWMISHHRVCELYVASIYHGGRKQMLGGGPPKPHLHVGSANELSMRQSLHLKTI